MSGIGKWQRLAGTMLFAFGDTWSLLAYVWGSRVKILSQFGPAEYGAVAAACTLGIVWLNWQWINAALHRKERQFQALEDDLLKGTHTNYGERISSQDSPEIRTIVRRLDALNIPHPSIIASRNTWDTFLHRLIGEVRAGALNEARRVLEEMRMGPTTEGEGGGESQ